jgi:signal transduction histidine kinase
MKDDIDINRVAEKAAVLVANLLKKSTLNFSMNLSQTLPRIRGNEQRLEQVVINLLVNACQALTERRQAVGVNTGFDEATRSVVLRVSDQGAGMSNDVIRRICDPFFTTKRENGGTGLGLSISQKIVQDHQGSMAFDSAPGEGTTVTVRLPVNPDRKDSQPR